MKKILSLFLALLLIASLFVASAESIKMAGSSGTIYLRKGPGTKYAANGTVSNGDSITVLSKGKVWTKIQTSDSREGYVKNLYIYGMSPNYADGVTYYGSAKSGKIVTKYASSKVNMRVGANKSEALVMSVKSGTKVKVLGKNGSWYLVSVNGTQGFIKTSYVSVGGSGGGSSSTKTAKVTASAVNMRHDANKNSKIMYVLSKNTKVTVLAKYKSGWWKVKYKGKEGYIYGKYLK